MIAKMLRRFFHVSPVLEADGFMPFPPFPWAVLGGLRAAPIDQAACYLRLSLCEDIRDSLITPH